MSGSRPSFSPSSPSAAAPSRPSFAPSAPRSIQPSAPSFRPSNPPATMRSNPFSSRSSPGSSMSAPAPSRPSAQASSPRWTPSGRQRSETVFAPRRNDTASSGGLSNSIGSGNSSSNARAETPSTWSLTSPRPSASDTSADSSVARRSLVDRMAAQREVTLRPSRPSSDSVGARRTPSAMSPTPSPLAGPRAESRQTVEPQRSAPQVTAQTPTERSAADRRSLSSRSGSRRGPSAGEARDRTERSSPGPSQRQTARPQRPPQQGDSPQAARSPSERTGSRGSVQSRMEERRASQRPQTGRAPATQTGPGGRIGPSSPGRAENRGSPTINRMGDRRNAAMEPQRQQGPPLAFLMANTAFDQRNS